MITSSDIFNKRFSVEINGYNQEEVDQYLEQLAEQIDIHRDNYGNLRRKVLAEGKRPDLIKRESVLSDVTTDIPVFSEEGNGYNKEEVEQFIKDVYIEMDWLRCCCQKMWSTLQEGAKRIYEPRPQSIPVNSRINETVISGNKNCPRCGNPILDTHLFCPSCGLSLNNQVFTSTVSTEYWPCVLSPQVNQTPMLQSYYQQQPSYEYSDTEMYPKQNKGKLVILALFVVAVLALVIMVFNGNNQGQGTKNAPSLTHVHNVPKWTVSKNATCSEAGLETGVCIICNQTVENSIPKLKHTEGNWQVVRDATVKSSGKKVMYCSVCGAEIKSESFEMTASEKQYWLIDNCKDFSAYDYSSIARNPDRYSGSYYTFRCSILQVVSESTSKDYYSVYRARIVGNNDADIYLCVDRYGSSSRILEKDIITVYGTFDGLKTYTTVLGASVTVPRFTAYSYSQ